MNLSDADWEALSLSLQLAGISMLILLVICIPLAWWLGRSKNRFLAVFDSLLALPIVLPPTVLGFYLLLTLGENGFIGKITIALDGSDLAFSFTGLVIGSVIYSLPFVIQPIQQAFRSIPESTLEHAQCLGAGKFRRFFSVALPISFSGIIQGAVLGFAHTLGEFGVILMIGGNIPGETMVASVALYRHVEALRFADAHNLALCLLLISFCLLIPVFLLQRSQQKTL